MIEQVLIEPLQQVKLRNLVIVEAQWDSQKIAKRIEFFSFEGTSASMATVRNIRTTDSQPSESCWWATREVFLFSFFVIIGSSCTRKCEWLDHLSPRPYTLSVWRLAFREAQADYTSIFAEQVHNVVIFKRRIFFSAYVIRWAKFRLTTPRVRNRFLHQSTAAGRRKTSENLGCWSDH